MKRQVFVLPLFILSMALVFTACQKNDTPPEETPQDAQARPLII